MIWDSANNDHNTIKSDQNHNLPITFLDNFYKLIEHNKSITISEYKLQILT